MAWRSFTSLERLKEKKHICKICGEKFKEGEGYRKHQWNKPSVWVCFKCDDIQITLNGNLKHIQR